MSDNGNESFLSMLLSARRVLATHLGAILFPIEFAGALARGNGFLIAIFGCLTVAMWIELASAHGFRTERVRWLQYWSIFGFVGLYLFYVVFRWREFLLDGF